MRHLHAGRKLNRSASHRKAMFKNLLSSLIEHGKVKTTLAKAKEMRSLADEIITLGKQGDLAARRQAFVYVRRDALLRKVFEEYAPRFKERKGGYTRVTKLGPRLGDAAEMAILEYLPVKKEAGTTTTTAKPKAKPTKKKATAKKKEAAPKKTTKAAKTTKKAATKKKTTKKAAKKTTKKTTKKAASKKS